jgi:hypothetical protein
MAEDLAGAVVDDIVDSVDTEVVETDAVDGVIDPAETADENAVAEQVVDDVEGDNRVVPKYIRDLQATDPKGYKKAKESFFQHRDFISAFPDGPTAAKEVLQVMADIGGAEGLAGLKTQAQELTALRELAVNAPENLAKSIAEASPNKVGEFALAGMSEYLARDPENYNRVLCGMVSDSLGSIKFESTLERAELLLEVGRTEDAVAVLKGLRETAGQFGKVAATPVQAKPQENNQVDQRSHELDKREASIFDNALASSIISYRDPFILKESAQWTKGKELTDRQKGSLVRDVTTEIGALLNKDAQWMKEYNAAVAKRDDKTAVRLYQDKVAKVGPEVVRLVSRELFGSPVAAAKPAVTPAVKPVPKPTIPGTYQGKKADKFDQIWENA